MLQVEECYSIDFVKNTGGVRCYWHDEAKELVRNDAVDQYRKYNSCPTTTVSTISTPGECVPQYTKLDDTRSVGGDENTQLTDSLRYRWIILLSAALLLFFLYFMITISDLKSSIILLIVLYIDTLYIHHSPYICHYLPLIFVSSLAHHNA